jgi:hypothetical protein
MKPENLAVLAVAVLAYLKLFGKSDAEKQLEKDLDEIKSKPLPRPNELPTIVNAEAQAIAERQFAAMNRPGTDEGDLFRSLNGLNGADLRLVFQAFGVRNYYLLRDPLNLFGWYARELNREELLRMKIYWYKSGLTF